ncbi:MAG: hypothetical protein ACYC5V_07800 [Gemmatimonadaceae bacterium]
MDLLATLLDRWRDDPARRIGELAVRFIPYGALAEHGETMTRFGSGSKAIEAIAKAL